VLLYRVAAVLLYRVAAVLLYRAAAVLLYRVARRYTTFININMVDSLYALHAVHIYVQM